MCKINNITNEEDQIFDNWSFIDDIEDEYISKEEYIEELREDINSFNDEYYCEDTQMYRVNKETGYDYKVWEEQERNERVIADYLY